MDLLLLQNAEEIELAKKNLKDAIKEVKIVAWTPFVLDSLRRANMAYSTVADFVSEEYQPDELIYQFRQYKYWCDRIDNHLSQAIPDIAALNLRPSFYKMVYLRTLFFLYFAEIKNLNSLFQKARVNNVYYFYYPRRQLSLLSRLMDVMQNNKWGMNFIRLKPENKYKPLFPANGLVSDWFDRRKKWEKIARYLIRRPGYKDVSSFLAGFLECRVFRNSNPNILVLNVHFDIEEVLKQLKQYDLCNFVFWEDVSVIKDTHPIEIPSDEIINMIKNDPQAHQWTTFHEIDIFDLCIPEIERMVCCDIPLIISGVRKFRKINSRFNFDLVITGHETTLAECVFDQCDELDIPVIDFMHGGITGLIKGYPEVPICFRGKKVSSKKYYFVYSEAMVDYLEDLKKTLPEFTVHNLPVGSHYYEKLLNKEENKKWKVTNNPRLCYVCGGAGVYNSTFKGGLYDDTSLYELRYNVVEKLKNKPNLTLYYKMGYNTENYGIEFEQKIVKGLWKNIKAVPSSKKLVEILCEMDVFIIEIPSTTLFEVLTTSKPVILLVEPRALALTDKAENMLKNRVTIVRSKKEMGLCLDDIVDNGINSFVFTRPNHDDKTFINTYATCGDFNSKNRTIDFLKTLLYKKRKTQSI